MSKDVGDSKQNVWRKDKIRIMQSSSTVLLVIIFVFEGFWCYYKSWEKVINGKPTTWKSDSSSLADVVMLLDEKNWFTLNLYLIFS